MKLNHRHYIILFFLILTLVILATETIWSVCQVCGMQQYERQFLGKTIEFLSQREFDEFGTHKQWMEQHGRPHQPHEWKVVIEPTIDLLKVDQVNN